MKNTGFILLLILLSINAQCQSNEFRNQRAQLAVFNIGFNGLIGGVGRLINNEENISGFQAFTKGFYQGAIGGAISHIGLSLTHQIQKQQNISYAWPARLVNSFGTSIIQNSAEGRRMFDRLHLNLFVTRLEYYPYQKRFTGRLFTSSIYGILVVGKNAKFNLKKSLQTGILYFESSQSFSLPGLGASGLATGQVSSIGMNTDLTQDDFYNVYAEETAHILQFDRKVGGNAILSKANKKLSNVSKVYNSLSKYIYFDLNGPLFWLGYKLAGTTHNCNFFEQEAVNYSYRRAYKCN
ncbi:hypothetical protein FNH22_29740 [Fulvivirga sp. M361]|uniref:hypothetical protein n=1 Tax=Fulvivirga sp. M361 TaxID=2594266 RepID=UPI00117A33B4|nr:hypothetical protein [Fulvivirga sp. M361]TRX48050.1 hypothetical protein FNH22_29740 [Fulvivirga sp. M361]